MNKKFQLKENSRWKIDSKDKKSWEKKKEKRNNYNQENGRYTNNKYEKNRNSEKNKKEVEELDVTSNTLFPSLFSVEENKNDNAKSEYLERINKKKEENDEKNKHILKDGWIAYKMKKGTHKVTVSRDGINYFDSLKETYTPEELEELENKEFQKHINILNYRLEQLYLKRKHESEEYYYLTGRMDSFAIAEKERQEYEIYEKQFETEESDLQTDELDDYDSDELVDSEDEFRKRR